eukprot:7306276-Prymnesium_polylepis.1
MRKRGRGGRSLLGCAAAARGGAVQSGTWGYGRRRARCESHGRARMRCPLAYDACCGIAGVRRACMEWRMRPRNGATSVCACGVSVVYLLHAGRQTTVGPTQGNST